jgi:hypothetical protein
MGWACSTRGGDQEYLHFGWEAARNHSEGLDVGRRKLIVGKLGWRVWMGFIWLKIGISGGLL